MALCPLAVASAGKQSDGSGDYYFSLAGGGGSGPTTESAYIAKGFPIAPGSQITNNGYFSAISEDTTGAGTDAFIMTDMSGVIRWGIGTSGVEAGANSGDNFAIYSYSDAGAFLAAPLTINRASGGVQMVNGLTVGNTLVSTGNLTAAGGDILCDQDISGVTIHAPNGYFSNLQGYVLRNTLLVRGSKVLLPYTTPNVGGFALDADAGTFNCVLYLTSPFAGTQTMAIQADSPEIVALPVGTELKFALAPGSNPIELFVNAGATFHSVGTFNAPAAGAPLGGPVITYSMVKVAQSVGGAVADWAKMYEAGAF